MDFKMIACPYCNTEIAEDAICPKCGSPTGSFLDHLYDSLSDAIEVSTDEIDFSPIEKRLDSLEGNITQLRSLLTTLVEERLGGEDFEAKSAFIGKQVELGSYPTNADGTKRPILWNMVAVEKRRALLISYYVLDCQPFSSDGVEMVAQDNDGNDTVQNFAPDYESSEIRAWLEDTFFNTAFTQEEKARIDTLPSLLSFERVSTLKAAQCEDAFFTDFANSKREEPGWWISLKLNPRSNAFISGELQCFGSRWSDVRGVRPVIWVNLD